jgi:hypothetical protein
MWLSNWELKNEEPVVLTARNLDNVMKMVKKCKMGNNNELEGQAMVNWEMMEMGQSLMMAKV